MMSFPHASHHLMRSRYRILLLATAGLLAVSQIQCLFIPNDEDGWRARNKPPHVKITAGLYESDSAVVHYQVDFRWYGWDDDGVVTEFEWAVDDTTLENSWHSTTEFGGRLGFRATGGAPNDSSGAHTFQWHRFFLRAVDNESARSRIETRLFSARTIAPETRITSPRFSPPRVLLPMSFEVVWEGEDIDSPDPDQGPEFFEFKLVRSAFNEDPVEALLEAQNIFLDTLQIGDRDAWIRVPSTTTSVAIENLTLSTGYTFGVRAIDEAGAVEPTLDPGENYVVFEVTEEACSPFVTIFEGRLGAFTFPTNGLTWSVNVPSDSPLNFQWVGDAAYCGRRAGKVKYALDPVEDQHAPDGIGGWTDWGDWEGLITPFVFPETDEGIVHHFFLKMRDDTHDPLSERFCWVQIGVQSFPFDRTVLIVDDATPPRGFAGTDAEHDDLRDRLLACAWDVLQPGEVVDFFDVFSGRDQALTPRTIALSTLARYRLVIWNNYLFSREKSGLAHNEFQRGLLSDYVGAGGNLYLFGAKPVSSLANDNYNDNVGMGICPYEDWDETSFIWEFLHLQSCVRGPRSNRVDGWIGARAVHPSYPDVNLSHDVWDPWREDPNGDPVGGIRAYQVYKAPPDEPPGGDSALDTIYVSQTFQWGGRSELEAEPCALRYAPQPGEPGLFQGRVFLQMFDLLFVQEEQGREAACRAIDWLLTGRDE